MTPIQDWLTAPNGIATTLRELRARAALTGVELATLAGWGQSRVSKLENGKQLPTRSDIQIWTEACGVPHEAEALLNKLDEVHVVHQNWSARMQRGQEEVQASYEELVGNATQICHFETVYVPGLVQTPKYAHRVLTEMIELHSLDIDDVEAAVASRMQRQSMLYDTSKNFELLVAEPVLYWRITSHSVMVSQLDRLQGVIGLPNLVFGVLPMGPQLKTVPQNSFQLYDNVAVVEGFAGETMHSEAESALYRKVLDRMWDEAVTGDAARYLIARASDKLKENT